MNFCVMRLIAVLILLIMVGDAYSFEQLWAYEAGGEIASPVIADVDGDGKKEVVFSTTDGFVYALRGDGGLMWSFMTGGKRRLPSNFGLIPSPTVADLDRDGSSEVIVPSTDGHLYVLSSGGELMWKYKILRATNRISEVETAPAVVDVDADGVLDIIFAANDGNIYALNITGGEVWSVDLRRYYNRFWFFKRNLRHGLRIISSPAVGDINSDGLLEVVIATRSSGDLKSKVFALNAHDGSLVWIFEIEKYETDASPSIADIDGDGVLEVIIGAGETPHGGGDKGLYVLEGGNGTLRWRFQAGGGLDASPSIADIDGDGRMEIVVGSLWDGGVYAVNHDGTLLWRYGTKDQVYSTAAIADVNGDDRLEGIVGSTDNNLYVIDGKTGGLVWKFRTEGRIYSSPAVADLDGDGKLEIVVGGGYRLYVLEAGKGKYEWPKFKYDLANTGLLGGLPNAEITPPPPREPTRKERISSYVYQKLFEFSNFLSYIKNRFTGWT